MSQHDASRQPASGPSIEDAQLSALVAALPLGVVISGPAGDLRLANPAAQELLDFNDPAFHHGDRDGAPAWTVVHEDGSIFPPEIQPAAVALATGRAVHNIVMGAYHAARKRWLWLMVSAAPELDDRGEVVRVVTTYSDITERRAFESRLAVSDRLAAMGTLAAGIAHEINNPLAYITANLSYAEQELADPDALSDHGRLTEVRHAIIEARDGVDRVGGIVAGMRTLARGEVARGPISVTQVLEAATGVIGNEIRARAKLTTRLADVPLVAADAPRLGQVFVNLLLNAADAIPEGQAADHEVAVSTSVDAGGWVVIDVRDTGAGIAPELHQRIFDPFFTNKPVGRGMGLGLAICHHIVTDLGGTISLESAPAQGSVFRVKLPAAPP